MRGFCGCKSRNSTVTSLLVMCIGHGASEKRAATEEEVEDDEYRDGIEFDGFQARERSMVEVQNFNDVNWKNGRVDHIERAELRLASLRQQEWR